MATNEWTQTTKTTSEAPDEEFEYKCVPCSKKGKHQVAEFVCENCKYTVFVRPAKPTTTNSRIWKNILLRRCKKECGLCLKEGHEIVGKYFCKNCNSLICDSCKDKHEKYEALNHHNIVLRSSMLNDERDIAAKFRQLSTSLCEESAKPKVLYNESCKPEAIEKRSEMPTKPVALMSVKKTCH